MSHGRAGLVLVVLFGFATHHAEAETIYRCTHHDGKIVLSNVACPEGANDRQETDVREELSPGRAASAANSLQEENRKAQEERTNALEESKRRIEQIRHEARSKDPVLADQKCVEARQKERSILRSDYLAERTRSTDLFELRNVQDLYCKEYRELNLIPPLRQR